MNDNVTLRDVASPEFVGVSESDSVLGTVELLAAENASAAVVLRGTDPVGTITAGDVFSLLADGGDPETTRVAEVMSDPPERISADARLTDAAAALNGTDAGRVLITDPTTGEPVGAVSPFDVVAAGAVERTQVAAEQSERSVGTTRERATDDEQYATPSICEACGSLARDLTNFNGQLLCADCIDV